jgi:purine-binding chemotaxis protein CheW
MSDVAPDHPDLDQPYLIALVEHVRLAIPSSWAAEMIVVPEISALPLSPAAIRGVGMRRGRTVTMLDARVRLGSPSRRAETDNLIALLEAREQDHVRWVETLLDCIDHDKPFTLARDPHACAFGKWYDHYVPPNLALKQHMAKFDEPHQAVHALADEAEQLLRTRGKAAAHESIEIFRSVTLGRMHQLFRDAARLLQDEVREIAITHEANGQLLGLVVDEVESVERLRPDTLEDLSGRVPGADDVLVRWSARTAKDHVVVLPDMDVLIDDVVPALATA